ncbi:PC-esterase domain-containing protein 1A [Plectropomus leopardus]|uniref:PC-esterase domain-containing protein 1A n=1 Tax=Plectropomus leopardus TaxID=160734 RepID=UPI001C4C2B8D|nr:PC-esterase domain-containing protein 1A [Plectropomus leopardus]
MKPVSHQQACQLLHNKFVVVLGDSIQRSVYKDLVLLLQKDKYLSLKQLKSKGEKSFEQDCLVEGGSLSPLHNGTGYREVRQFQSAHHLIRFYFVTRIFSRYMESVLADFRHGLKPDVVILNSCVWDISRYNSTWLSDYKENLHRFFGAMREILPEETLVIWNLTMPLGERIRGGFLIPEIEHKAPQLRYDVIDGNFYSGTLADAYGMDVLDLHFQFRFSLQHRTKDGIHWNALAHRKITSLLLQHTAEAWGVIMTCPLATIEHNEVTAQQPANGNATKHAGVLRASNHHSLPPTKYFSNTEKQYGGYWEEFHSDYIPFGFDYENNQRARRHGGAYGPAPPTLLPLLPDLRHQFAYGWSRNGFNYRPPHHFQPYDERHHQQVMRTRHTRHHYAPYTQHRLRQYSHNACYY